MISKEGDTVPAGIALPFKSRFFEMKIRETHGPVGFNTKMDNPKSDKSIIIDCSQFSTFVLKFYCDLIHHINRKDISLIGLLEMIKFLLKEEKSGKFTMSHRL